MRVVAAFAVALAAALLVPGCLSEAIVDKYQDAKVRAAQKTAGAAEDTRAIEVPAGTKSLTVKAAFKTAGDHSFRLTDPLGKTAKHDSGSGVREVEDEAWYTVQNPAPGTWKLTVRVDGVSEYSFGIYLG